jgi:acyl-CoA thioester hydrolase
MSFELDLLIRLDWSEMDLFGHVNNVAYFKYVQAARVNYLEAIGINTADPDNKLSFVLAHSSCNYKQPLYFPGEIIVKTKTDWVKNSSMQLNHTIYNEKKEVCAEAIDIIVLFDYATHSKVSISQEIREKATGAIK